MPLKSITVINEHVYEDINEDIVEQEHEHVIDDNLVEDVIDENALEGGVEEMSDHMKRMGSDVMGNINDATMLSSKVTQNLSTSQAEPLGEVRAATRYNLRRNTIKNKIFYSVSLNNISSNIISNEKELTLKSCLKFIPKRVKNYKDLNILDM